MPYAQLDDASYTGLRKKLLHRKGSAPQREFVEALLSSEDFVRWMRRVERTTGEEPPVLQEPLTDSEFINPPTDTERNLYALWREVAPADACRATFWGAVTLRHIEHEKIEAADLVRDTGDGHERIGRALRAGNEQEIDHTVRAALRRLSGLPEARGETRSVFADCPFARAWWRGYLAADVLRDADAEGEPADSKAVHDVLHHGQGWWEALTMFVVSRNSVLGDTRVRSALILALAEIDPDERSRTFTGGYLKQVLRRIGVRQAWQELGVLALGELKRMMREEFLPEPDDDRQDGREVA